MKLSKEVMDRALSLGEPGKQWISALDATVRTLEEQWNISVSSSLSGGTHAFVAYADRENGERCVLKLDVPEEPDAASFIREIRTLQIADGQSYTKLLTYDIEKRACLMERLGMPLSKLQLPVSRQIEILCQTLKKAWQIPVEQAAELSSGSDSIAWFRGHIVNSWEAFGKPCSETAVQRGLCCLQSRKDALDGGEQVLVHGDVHSNNTLAVLDDESSFKFIDPDGIFYEKAYDLGVLMREWIDDYRADPIGQAIHRCRFLHELTEVPELGIFDWGYLQTLSTGLVLLQIGQRAYGMDMLRLAEIWAETERIWKR